LICPGIVPISERSTAAGALAASCG
jgi:hypothetical protein